MRFDDALVAERVTRLRTHHPTNQSGACCGISARAAVRGDGNAPLVPVDVTRPWVPRGARLERYPLVVPSAAGPWGMIAPR